MAEPQCPDCGTALTGDETVCPNCGCPLTDNDPQTNLNYNEAEPPYFPMSDESWFFSAPSPLSNYPDRGDFRQAHPFWGWLFGPWHLSYNGCRNKAAYDTLNNFFLSCNLQFKAFLYPALWVFFKLIWWVVALIVISVSLPYLLDYFNVNYALSQSIQSYGTVFIIIAVIVLYILAAILFCCGLAKSLHRYWSPLYENVLRICKRIALAITKSVKANNINS